MKALGWILALSVVSAPAALAASSSNKFLCKQGSVERRVEVQAGSEAPGCQVMYYKDTEAPGASSKLWEAKNEQNYCEKRATDFVEKLKGMGWNCQDSSIAH